jgi:uncharacterized protein (DUF885 family)
MKGFSHALVCGIALGVLAGCGSSTAPAPVPAAKPDPKGELGRIVERYWDEHLNLEDVISPQLLADSLNIERRYLAELEALPGDSLDAESRLTYDIFKRRRELAIEGFTYPSELLPINPFGGMVLRFAAQAANFSQRPGTAADYQNWPKRIDEYVRWTQQAMTNLRDGTRRGYTMPRVLVQRMLPILERLGADDADNVLRAPLRSMPENIKDPERTRLTKAISDATLQKLLPANRALHSFLEKEYLPRARTSIAWSALPLGSLWYAYYVKRATSTSLSPGEIHRLGMAQVERLGAAPAPMPRAPLAANELLDAYRQLKVQVTAAVPQLFSEDPKTDFDIRGTDWTHEPGTPLSYQPAGPTASSPPVLYVDIGRGGTPAVVIASFLEQAIPGRHYQITLQQERADLPRFRRFGAEPAFTDGWGRYAASQGEALGLYPDEAAKSDAAAEELRCAVGSVVDTGLHAEGWTRAQAVDYLGSHLGLTEPDAQLLIDWYAANPADALACMMGELKIRELRSRAQQSLGGHFDVREFHSEILKGGAMPLDILEAKMKTWMNASK